MKRVVLALFIMTLGVSVGCSSRKYPPGESGLELLYGTNYSKPDTSQFFHEGGNHFGGKATLSRIRSDGRVVCPPGCQVTFRRNTGL